MELLYIDEHTACINYQRWKPSLIEIRTLSSEQELRLNSEEDKLIYLKEGSLRFSFSYFIDYEIDKGKILILPAGYKFQSRAIQNCSIIIVCITQVFKLCEYFPLEKLLEVKCENYNYDLSYISANEALSNCFYMLELYHNKEIRCSYFLNIKIKELFFILRAFYPKEKLRTFFHLLLTNDMHFSKAVYQHYRQAHNAQELATLLNYSYSGFIKRFNQVFNQSPYKWMRGQKAQFIRNEINTTDKSLSEIAREYGFSSQGNFTDFCKAFFGLPPSELRKQNKRG